MAKDKGNFDDNGFSSGTSGMYFGVKTDRYNSATSWLLSNSIGRSFANGDIKFRILQRHICPKNFFKKPNNEGIWS